MRTDTGTEIKLADYKPPAYLIDTIDLVFELGSDETIVRANLVVRRPEYTPVDTPLFLDGDELTLLSLTVDGNEVAEDQVSIAKSGLTVRRLPSKDRFTIETAVRIHPSKNTQLMGLYSTKGNFCTQCEAEGFRRITFFPDRPDVLSIYTVRLEADAGSVPLLLSNGNMTDSGTLEDGGHFAVWHDPFPKPSYLFAVFAGDLGVITDSFKTMSGRDVRLEIYVEHGKEARASYAMDALKRSMKWDEDRFGREYDLDVFMIVAVSDFNMGAMENKGLNVFNDKYVLADPATATDTDYANIEAIIAHEYFHNWTGNRITCRDWFQLCLKEGLTVYRDHEFSADMRSRAVRRISEVRGLRAHQFPEDAGPLAHPVRPKKYSEINNFYTATVYEKGSELVRMLNVILGEERFQAGMDLYFDRHDGDAATIEDFIACFAEAAGEDLSQFARWYDHAGTPNLAISTDYDSDSATFTVTVQQSVRSGVPSSGDGPRHIPVTFALLGDGGAHLEWASVTGGKVDRNTMHLRDARETFVFHGVEQEPVLSALRGFSAPVTRIPALSISEAQFIARHDDDPFSRWDALNSLCMRAMKDAAAAAGTAETVSVDPDLVQLLVDVAADETFEPAFRALCLTPPNPTEIAREIGASIDPVAIHKGRENVLNAIASAGHGTFKTLFDESRVTEAYSPSSKQAGARALCNVLLGYLARCEGGHDLAADMFASANNMTDSLAALNVLAHQFPQHDKTISALDTFRNQHAGEPVVLDKWLSIQAMVPDENTLDTITHISRMALFSWRNPNRVRALLGAFATGNPVAFNRPDGASYAFFCDSVLKLDGINPQVAARLMTAMRSWRDLEPVRRDAAHDALKKLSANANLSRDLSDIVGRTLN
ncbi:MAG: aminopeptidase N [Pseudomonadota bacterium]